MKAVAAIGSLFRVFNHVRSVIHFLGHCRSSSKTLMVFKWVSSGPNRLFSAWEDLWRSCCSDRLVWAVVCTEGVVFPLDLVLVVVARFFVVGCRVLLLRLTRHCAGVVDIPWVGVLHRVVPNVCLYTSARTVWLFDCCLNLPGLMVRCWNSHNFEKCANSWQENWEPLSLITVSRHPYLAKWLFSLFITVVALVLGSWSISQKLL